MIGSSPLCASTNQMFDSLVSTVFHQSFGQLFDFKSKKLCPYNDVLMNYILECFESFLCIIFRKNIILHHLVFGLINKRILKEHR